MEKRRLDYIDGLRGLAALMVIVVHCANFVEQGVLPDAILSWLKLGRYGVQIFYIISGFTIMMSVERQKNSGGGYNSFYLRRIFRIFPLWWIALAGTLVYNSVVRDEMSSLGNIISHVFALHGLFPQYIGDIVGQGWSISIEMMFYFLVPFIIKICKDKLDNYIKLIALFSIIMFPINLVGDKVLSVYFSNTDGSFCYLWLPNQLIAFLIGMSLYLIVVKNKSIENWKSTSMAVLGIIAVLFFSLSTVLTVSIIEAILVIALSKYPSPLINNKFFHYIGKVSYGVYLSHMMVIFVMQDFGLLSNNWVVSLILYFVGVPVISTVIGTITYYGIEKPLLKLERKIERKHNNFELRAGR